MAAEGEIMKRPLAGLLLISAAALARQQDGTLDVIVTPNSGVPVILLPGQSFDVVLTRRADLHLANDGPGPALAVEWYDMPGDRVQARCVMDPDAEPGEYALEAVVDSGVDRNPRAVYIRRAYPDYYLVAHVTDPHIGSARHVRDASDIFRDVIAATNESKAAFALITGDLTQDGTPEQLQEFLRIMDGCTLPTFVCPGNHDRAALNYEQFFGPLAYMFCFGQDGYIAFDTKDYLPADELGAQDADLEVFRRDIKAARWSIGFTHRYEAIMGMRSQIVLFLDNPLDHLIFGHWHRANDDTEEAVPWGTTPITVTPAAVDGMMRLFDVSAQGVKPRPPQRVAALE